MGLGLLSGKLSWARWSPGFGGWAAGLAAGLGGALAAGALGAPVAAPAAGTSAASAAPAAPSPTLQKIRARGEVAIGVRTDFPPFAMLDAKGRPRGLEVDLAQALANRWGVRLRLVPVTPEDRFLRLSEGAVDLIIASAGDTPQRRLGATAIEPHYYGSGVGVMLPPGPGQTQWSHLRGSTVCAVQGAAFNAPLARRHQLQLHALPTLTEALRALEQGVCKGLLYSEAGLHHLRSTPAWRAYRAPLDPAWVVPWAISIGRGEQGTQLERAVGDAVAAWHREGTLIALEKKWGLQPSRFLQAARARWSERRLDGTWVCARDAKGDWPTACRDPVFVPPQEAQGLLAFAHWLQDKAGVRLAPQGEAFDGGRYLQSLGLTALLAAAAVAGVGLTARRGARAWRAWRLSLPRPVAPRPARTTVSRVMLGSLGLSPIAPLAAIRRPRPRPLRPRRGARPRAGMGAGAGAGGRRLIRP